MRPQSSVRRSQNTKIQELQGDLSTSFKKDSLFCEKEETRSEERCIHFKTERELGARMTIEGSPVVKQEKSKGRKEADNNDEETSNLKQKRSDARTFFISIT